MTREIVLDTETTGLSPRDGHRIVEIGAVEIINQLPTGKFFHAYLNPERDMPKEAEAVHGLSAEFLKGKPKFAAIAKEFLAFVADSVLVIHNASFDMGFINAELAQVKLPAIEYGQVIDTLAIAKQKFPMASNSLDALCKRFGIDLSKRTKHGALLDSELLAEVYLELTGGKQTALGLAAPNNKKSVSSLAGSVVQSSRARPNVLPPRLTPEDIAQHQAFIESLDGQALWHK